MNTPSSPRMDLLEAAVLALLARVMALETGLHGDVDQLTLENSHLRARLDILEREAVAFPRRRAS